MPVLASDPAITPRRYLVSNFGKLYFWTPSNCELLYVAERYDLEGVLQRMNDDNYQFQTKPMEPLALHYKQHQIPYLSLWFWQIPRGWKQDLQDFNDLKEMFPGQDFGLPLPVPILVSVGIPGNTEFLMKCGKDFYIFSEIPHYVYHIDEPSELHDILSTLDTRAEKHLKTTFVNLLPEYGGPNVVADDNVPIGWSNKIDKGVSCASLFYKHDISNTSLLLFSKGSSNEYSKYLVEAGDGHYIWNTVSDQISRIDKAQGLEDILDILKDPSRHLHLSPLPPLCRSKVPPGDIEKGLVVQRSRV